MATTAAPKMNGNEVSFSMSDLSLSTSALACVSRRESICEFLSNKFESSVRFQGSEDDVHQGCVGSRILTGNQLAILDRMRMPCLDIGNLSASNLQSILGKEKRIALED